MSNKKRTSMSVPEMGAYLGIGKTTSYWLCKQGWFDVIMVGTNPKTRKMRVMIDSFEKWYQSQSDFKKATDEIPVGWTFPHKGERSPEDKSDSASGKL